MTRFDQATYSFRTKNRPDGYFVDLVYMMECWPLLYHLQTWDLIHKQRSKAGFWSWVTLIRSERIQPEGQATGYSYDDKKEGDLPSELDQAS
jgi:hypothetical protein